MGSVGRIKAHDTLYTLARGIDPANFRFLTGPEPAIRHLLTQFSVIAVADEGIWKHTLNTGLIDRHGRIVHRIDGSAWEPEEILSRLQVRVRPLRTAAPARFPPAVRE